MAIQQVLTVYLNLKGDGAASTFSFALQNLYQFANGIAVPFGGAGVVPTAVAANNPPVPVTSVSVDANGNITLTLTSPLGNGVVATFQLDLTFTSGSSSSSSATQTQNVTVVGSSQVTIGAGSAVIGHVVSDSGSVTNATLSAETTKVIGVTRTADGAGNLLTTNSTTPAAHFALDTNITSILGTAPTTVGKLDVKGADGDVFVRQATGTNLHTVVDSGTVTANIGTTNGLALDASVTGLQVSQGSTTSGQKGGLVLAAVTTSAPTYSTGQTSALSLDTSGNLRVVGSFSSGALPDATTAISLTAAAQTAQILCAGRGSFGFILTSVGTGGTVQAEGSIDGTNWFSIDVWSESLETWVSGTINVTGQWWFEPLGSLNAVRVRCTAITSGTITGNLIASTAAMGTFEYQTSPGQAVAPNIVSVGGSVTTAAPSYSTGTANSLSLDTFGALRTTTNDTSTGSTALGALNAAISVSTAGQSTVGFQLAAGTLIGTIVPEISIDGGTTWFATQFKDPVRSSYFPNYIFAAANTAVMAAVDTSGGITNARVRVSAFTSGTANAVMNANKIGHSTLTTSAIDGQKVTYSASVRGFTPVASATSPIVLFTGSATKICRITKITWSFSAGTGSTTFPNWTVQRFSTITGGTVANTATVAKNDINDPNATATVTQYSTVPTTATANGGITHTQRFQWVTASATVVSPVGFSVLFGGQPGTKELMTRTATDFIGIVLDSIGTTPVASITIEWTEE